MKPQDNKIWIPTADSQIHFLEFIRTQFRNGKYKMWNCPTIPIIDHRIRIVSDVIKHEGYYKHTTAHRTLINIRNEYDNFQKKIHAD